MNSAQTSLKVFGIYLIVVPGLGLMFAPETMLELFGLGLEGSPWMARMVGVLASIIGTLDWLMARHHLDPLYPWTVVLRGFAASFMVALWVSGEAGAMILAFAAADYAGAAWTFAALAREP